MNALDGLDYLFDEPPAAGARLSVSDGIDWIRLPLPFRLNHVNCWWLPDDRLQIDTGVASETTRALWRSALHDVRPRSLLVTHFHPDHAGLAGEFAQEGVALFGNEIEMTLSSRIWSTTDQAYGALYAGWYRRNGLTDDVVDAVSRFGNGYRRIVSEPPPLVAAALLVAGDTLTIAGRDWRIMTGEGHAPSMLMLFDPAARVLIAADQVLPGISPNVSCAPESGAGEAPFGRAPADPLALFLATLKSLRALPEDTLVLPSHGLPFRGLHRRIDALSQHHELRLAQVLEACAAPRSAGNLFQVLFGRKLDAQQTSFALGEALAHLRHLETQGLLVRDTSDGIDRYERS